MIQKNWWKFFCVCLLLYSVIAGFFVTIPLKPVIEESIRNLFFHVGMWFGMFAMLVTGFINSLRYLRNFNAKRDVIAEEAIRIGLFFGILGILTGMIWGNYTWGAIWIKDPKLFGAAVGILIYLAYMILRGSVRDEDKRAKVAAVYNILAFFLWIVFVIVLPRVAGGSIHPATDGNELPVLPMNLDPAMRMVFYPAMVGWVLLTFWILQIRVRIREIKILTENN